MRIGSGVRNFSVIAGGRRRQYHRQTRLACLAYVTEATLPGLEIVTRTASPFHTRDGEGAQWWRVEALKPLSGMPKRGCWREQEKSVGMSGARFTPRPEAIRWRLERLIGSGPFGARARFRMIRNQTPSPGSTRRRQGRVLTSRDFEEVVATNCSHRSHNDRLRHTRHQ
jgi:hypothetical protein